MNGHAPRGGCIGVNGEFYEGGKFLPSNPDRPRGMSTNYGTKKCEIEPYVWDIYKGELKPDEIADGFYKMLTVSFRVSFIHNGGTQSEYFKFIKPYKEAWEQGKRWRIFKRVPGKGIDLIRFE
jgi:hypothetical protein